jgi:hypothetical protein
MKALLSYKLLKEILIVLFTLLGGYVAQQVILARAKPILIEQVIKTDLAGLSLDNRSHCFQSIIYCKTILVLPLQT